ncbi:hypothetical protein PFISCL1PPCAC_7094, partial [Pristionchus fissidentatus]
SSPITERMRLLPLVFIFLVIVIASQDSETKGDELKAEHFTFPPGTSGLVLPTFPDGSLLTFYFEHGQMNNNDESIGICFVTNTATKSCLVHQPTYPVSQREQLKAGIWTNPVHIRIKLNKVPTSAGWWRVDIYKMSHNKAFVFFQGFTASWVVTFRNTLNTAKLASINGYPTSANLNRDQLHISHKFPKDELRIINSSNFDIMTG